MNTAGNVIVYGSIDNDMFDEKDLIIEQINNYINDHTIQFTLKSGKYNTPQVAGTFAIMKYKGDVLDYTMDGYSMLFPKATIKRRTEKEGDE